MSLRRREPTPRFPGTFDKVPADLAAEGLPEARRAAEMLVGDLRTELEGIIAAQTADPPDDEHDAEGATVGFERARVTALLAHAERRLAAIDASVDAAAAGRYGRCERCGAPIGDERLEALPEATLCVSCAR